MSFHNPNLGRSPYDPDYDENFDAEAEEKAYEEACFDREEYKRECEWAS